jgi:thiamine-phosphate pyrophosphorylase
MPQAGASIRGLYPILDTRACRAVGVEVTRLAQAVADAGVGIAQFRHKGPYRREILAEAEAVGRILRAGGVRYIIDDRADVALMIGADGVHVGQEDLAPRAVRRLAGPGLWIGFSTHNEAQLRGAEREPADYLALGPIFSTGSKENPDPVVGLAELPRLRPLTSKPLVAIGGLTRENARQVLEAGADAVAVISDLLADDLPARLRQWREAVEL